MKSSFKGKILPAIHPDSVRVRLIARDVIEALKRGLRQEEKVWSDLGYAESGGETLGGKGETVMALSESESGEGVKWEREDEVLDDKWVEDSRKRGKESGSRSAISHLEGLNWEVLVVNEPVVNALCLPGGKIVVFTGLLEHFRTDPEIATIIGHDVVCLCEQLVVGVQTCRAELYSVNARLGWRMSQKLEFELGSFINNEHL